MDDGVIFVLRDLLPEGWELEEENMGIDSLLICPCGHQIEQDGRCPEGCVSPLRELGVI